MPLHFLFSEDFIETEQEPGFLSISKAKTYVYFFTTSPTTINLFDGFYQFSSEGLNKPAPF